MRQHGYKVQIVGWLQFNKSDIDSQHAAITTIKAGATDPAVLAGKLTAVKIETRQSSYDPDEATQVRRTRKAAGK